MLIGKDTVAKHEPRTGLHGVLRQKPRHQLGGCFPDHRVQARVEAGELRPESDQANPAIELGQWITPQVTRPG
jgi:hypothetical protein